MPSPPDRDQSADRASPFEAEDSGDYKDQLTVSIELGEGKVEQIIVTNNDDPALVAERFCTELALPHELQL